MAHRRSRHIYSSLAKRQKLWPILGVLGPRQVGKSTLLRDQLCVEQHAPYVSFDVRDTKSRAERQPDYFLKSYPNDSGPVVIDEVQKVPAIFDALKANVDADRRPGKFILSGSTEFSQKTGIRESLTGRIGLLRLFPMTLAETMKRPFYDGFVSGRFLPQSRVEDVERWLTHGGMPSHCFLRSADERHASWSAWIDTVCFRDLAQFKGLKLDGDLARDIFDTLPNLERATLANIAAKLKIDARRVKRHVEALEALFLLQQIRPHPAGTGREEWQSWDTGRAHLLGASMTSRLRTLCMNECLAQHEYAGKGLPKLFYFQSAKGARADLVVEFRGATSAFILWEDASLSPYLARTVASIRRHLPDAKIYVVAPISELFREWGATILPWTALG
jgi:predicted AAA+ superfamily ATPase